MSFERDHPINNEQVDIMNLDELREIVHGILTQQKKWVLGTGSTGHYALTEDLLVSAISHHLEKAELKARIDEVKTAQKLLNTKPLDNLVSASKERVMNDWFLDKIAIYTELLTTNKSKEK